MCCPQNLDGIDALEKAIVLRCFVNEITWIISKLIQLPLLCYQNLTKRNTDCA